MKEFIKEALMFNPFFEKWNPPQTRVYEGKVVKGRPTRGFGDGSFNYAGKHMNPERWDSVIFMPIIKAAAERVAEQVLGKKVRFTFCLCGYYSHMGEGIPHHSDTVPEYDDIVLSASFGSPRVFEWIEYSGQIKDNCNTSDINIEHKEIVKKESYIMEHGDIMLFDGYSQMNSTHAVPEVMGPLGDRINMTFRSGL
jgi:alkylated DNA repair dioxygenase AlkB